MTKNNTGTFVKRVRQNKKYFVIGVLDGKVVEKVRWSSKQKTDKNGRLTAISSKLAATQFKQSFTFDDQRNRLTLLNKHQVTDYSVTVKKGSDRDKWRGRKEVVGVRLSKGVGQYQWVCEGQVQHRNKLHNITARSEQHDKGYPFSKARDEAFERFLMRLDGLLRHGHGSGDANRGNDNFNRVSKFKEGAVYYESVK